MSSGPILIYDKSMLEMLSLDETVWLAQFFRVNVTPLFLVETLADLEKEVSKGRTPEDLVGRLAQKTSAMSADPNIHHTRIVAMELIGEFNHDGRPFPVVGEARPVVDGGRRGFVFNVSREAQALNRWQKRRFIEAEREFARGWRADLESLDLKEMAERFAGLLDNGERLRNLAAVKERVDAALSDPDLAESMLGAVIEYFDVPSETLDVIYGRWEKADRAILPGFAPYSAHVLAVDMFFGLALKSGLIGSERPSNRIDIAYLYYLPFCMVFTSNDRLHVRAVPLFLGRHQRFVPGDEFKADLKRIDEYFDALPDETKAQGVMKFANRPPPGDGYLVTQLWKELLGPRSVEPPVVEADTPDRRELHRRIMEDFNRIRAAPPSPSARRLRIDEADFVVMEREMPVRMGKWQIVPPDAVKRRP